MSENRRHFRLHKQWDVMWSIPEQQVEGEGVVFNISQSGMLFETDKLFAPAQGLVMDLKVIDVPLLPSKGELAWFRKVGRNHSHYQCGAQFLFDAVQNPLWLQWMEDNILKLAQATDCRILDTFLNEGTQD